MAEKVAWIAIGVVLMLSAHLIPALTREVGRPARVAAMAVWGFAVLATGYTHATFFVNAQRHAGEARAANVVNAHAEMALPPTVGRPIEQIANERARVERDLAVASIVRCAHDCNVVAARKTGLSARLTALNIELDEARRRARIADDAAAERARVAARQDAAIVDPVVARLAQLLKVETGFLDLLLSLVLGWLVEAIACVAWLVAIRPLRHPPRHDAALVEHTPASTCVPPSRQSSGDGKGRRVLAPCDMTSVQALPLDGSAANDSSAECEPVPKAEPTNPSTDDSSRTTGVSGDVSGSELEHLMAAIRAGAVRPTIASIRTYMSCTEARAMTLRRQLATLNPSLMSSRAGTRA